MKNLNSHFKGLILDKLRDEVNKQRYLHYRRARVMPTAELQYYFFLKKEHHVVYVPL